MEYPTQTAEGIVPAIQACVMPPSPQMKETAQKVVAFLQERGAQHVDVVVDFRHRGEQGTLTVRWAGEVSPAVVAENFAVSTKEDGTPLVPAWLHLRKDDEFDLRWQPPF